MAHKLVKRTVVEEYEADDLDVLAGLPRCANDIEEVEPVAPTDNREQLTGEEGEEREVEVEHPVPVHAKPVGGPVSGSRKR